MVRVPSVCLLSSQESKDIRLLAVGTLHAARDSKGHLRLVNPCFVRIFLGGNRVDPLAPKGLRA